MRTSAPPSLIGPLVLTAVLCVGTPTRAADPPDAAKRPDWKLLDRAIVTGDYAKAVELADEIVNLPKPKRNAPDFLARSLETVRALARRGFAELRLGRLDEAEATLTKAFRTFKDDDVQRLYSLESRKPNPAVAAKVVAVELAWVDLLNTRCAVMVERIRYANLAREAGDAIQNEEQEINRWIRELEILRKLTAAEQRTLSERFAEGAQPVKASPLARSLAGSFWPAMLSGIAALEISKLPFDVPRPGKSPPPSTNGSPAAGASPDDGRRKWLADSLDSFAEAGKALGEAIAASSPKGVAGLAVEGRIEASLLQADLLTHRGAALTQAGDLAAARADFERAIELQGEVAKLRQDVRAGGHPDLIWPLMLSAEVAVEEMQRHLSAGKTDRAETRSSDAARLLTRAGDLPVPAEHPLRRALATLSKRLERQKDEHEKAVPGLEAADAAALRLQRAIEASAASSADF